MFDPDQSSNPNAPVRDPNTKVENRMVYVVAFEEDGYARDVTPRYAREFGAKVSKMQQGGKGRKQWWEMVVGTMTRPYRLVSAMFLSWCVIAEWVEPRIETT